MVGEIASRGQLRAAFARWAVVTVPFLLLLGFTSARLAPAGAENHWYQALVKPVGTPPDWVFPVAWTLIYILMGLALAIVLNARGSRFRGPAIALFAVQLVVNLLWTPLFFGLHKVWPAVAVIALLFVLATATTMLFGRVRSLAGWLMVPYLAWLVYAGLLAYGIAQANPDAGSLARPGTATQVIG